VRAEAPHDGKRVGSGGSSFPFEVAAVPGPDEALGEEKDEDEHREQCAGGQAGERDGEREEKEDLDVEDQEEDRVEIVVGLELDPRIAAGREAAFVGRVFERAGFRGLEEFHPRARDAEHHQRKRDRHAEKQGKKRVGVIGHNLRRGFRK